MTISKQGHSASEEANKEEFIVNQRILVKIDLQPLYFNVDNQNQKDVGLPHARCDHCIVHTPKPPLPKVHRSTGASIKTIRYDKLKTKRSRRQCPDISPSTSSKTPPDHLIPGRIFIPSIPYQKKYSYHPVHSYTQVDEATAKCTHFGFFDALIFHYPIFGKLQLKSHALAMIVSFCSLFFFGSAQI